MKESHMALWPKVEESRPGVAPIEKSRPMNMKRADKLAFTVSAVAIVLVTVAIELALWLSPCRPGFTLSNHLVIQAFLIVVLAFAMLIWIGLFEETIK